jgi:hemolysin III
MNAYLKDPVSGLSHAAGLLLALVGAGFLLGRAHDAASVTVSAIYGACLIVLYTASSIYHLMPAGERLTRGLRLFDHIAIFLFVAGTSTPVLHHALTGRARIAMLGVMWGLAFAGVIMKLTWRSAPRAIYTLMYVGMGWSVLGAFHALRSLPMISLACVIGGGIVYTLGAVIYALKWPNPRPPTLGFHEIWHFFVLGGSVLHFIAIAQLG